MKLKPLNPEPVNGYPSFMSAVFHYFLQIQINTFCVFIILEFNNIKVSTP